MTTPWRNVHLGPARSIERLSSFDGMRADERDHSRKVGQRIPISRPVLHDGASGSRNSPSAAKWFSLACSCNSTHILMIIRRWRSGIFLQRVLLQQLHDFLDPHV